jgi:EAL and modified HD-GYP domain-containing signal transduction protein
VVKHRSSARAVDQAAKGEAKVNAFARFQRSKPVAGALPDRLQEEPRDHDVMDTFLARQPIFDHRRRVFAYELLFRSGPENYFRGPDNIMPSASVISSGMLGLPELTDGKPAFVNFSRESLLNDFARVLSPEEVIIELLETVRADPDVMAACEQLKKAGFRIALDDFVQTEETAPLLRFADFIKVDVLSTTANERQRLASELAPAGVSMLAEKVESWEMFGHVAESGYKYFQGYFFSRPIMVSSKAIPGFRLNYLRLVEELSHPTSVDRLEGIIKQEASIAYRLLRRVNSLAFGFRAEVRSLRHALVLLGEHEIRTSAMVWLLAEIGQESPSEVVVASTLRARACELLATEVKAAVEPSELFLVGLFSMLDALMERPMEQVVANLPVSDAVRDALTGRNNALKTVLDCVMAYERGGWSQAVDLARSVGIDADALSSSYCQALIWVNHVFRQPER